MKISVITICYNAVNTIEDTVQSVLSQGHPELEYVVIDGKSTDGTVDVLEKYGDQIDVLISEPDKGLYDALNKGIKNATGEVVGILHADDLFASPDVISRVANAFNGKKDVDAVYGDLNYVQMDGQTVHRKWKAGNYQSGAFQKGWMPPHPTFFIKRDLFDQYGYYRTEFSQSADYELMLRFIEKHKVRVHYLPEVLTLMRVGGKSNISIKNRIEANRQDLAAWKVNGLKPPKLFRIRKPLSKVRQFLG